MDYSKFKYVVTGYPRSGTAWVSQLLSIPMNAICIHEPEVMGDISEYFQTYEFVGACSSGEPIRGGKINNSRVAVINRDFQDCYDSFVMAMQKSGASDIVMAGIQPSIEIVRSGIVDFKQKHSILIQFDFKHLFTLESVKALWNFAYPEIDFNKYILKIKQTLKMNIQLNKLPGH